MNGSGSNIHTDPEKLEKAAEDLEDLGKKISDHITRLQGELERLGNTWRDEEYIKFNQKMTEAFIHFEKFQEFAETERKRLNAQAKSLSS